MTSAAVMTLLLTSLAAAQERSTTHGFIIGVSGQGTSVRPDDGIREQGGGVGFDVAWGFRNGLSIFLSGSGSVIDPDDEEEDEYKLGHGDFGLRYTFRNMAARFRPYGEVGVSTVHTEFQNVDMGVFGRSDVKVSGPALTAGGGVDLYLTGSTAIDLGVRWSTGHFATIEADGVEVQLEDEDYDLTTLRLQAGLRYHFAAK